MEPIKLKALLPERVIKEQSSMGGMITMPAYTKEIQNLDPHIINQTASLLGFYIPLIGTLALAADAMQYYKEGDYYNSGLMTIFASLPMIGPIGRLLMKIPGVGPVTTKMMAKLGQKIAAAKSNVKAVAKMLNPKEWKIIKKLIENKNLVKAELNKYFQRLAQKAPKYIKSIGKKGSAVIRQIGNGTVSITKALARLAKFGVKTFGPFYVVDKAWEKLYFDLGIDKMGKGEQYAYTDYSISSDPDLYPTTGNYVYKQKK